MDPETIEIVRTSCRALPEDRVEFTREFYRQLFEIAPQSRPMFEADLSAHHERLLHGILAAVTHLDRPEIVEGHLRRWGADHRRLHGVTDDLYPFVAHSLIRAMHQLFGHLDTNVASAWVAVYEWMAAVMIDGADRADALAQGQGHLLPTR